MHFGISEGKGGLKHGSRPWLGMDIFWNCPIGFKCYMKKAKAGTSAKQHEKELNVNLKSIYSTQKV